MFKDIDDIYPLTIIKDKYTGVYSGGQYTAWNVALSEVPKQIQEDDVACRDFWSYGNPPRYYIDEYSKQSRLVIGVGNTIEEAISDLIKNLNAE